MSASHSSNQAGYSGHPGRMAKKLCAPCCWEISQKPMRYCDAVSVPGETYCREHQQQHEAAIQKSKKSGFMPLGRTAVWRIRAWS